MSAETSCMNHHVPGTSTYLQETRHGCPAFNKNMGNNLCFSRCKNHYEKCVLSHNCSKLTQSQKWLEDLPSNMKPQMWINNQKHFYIFEPLETFQNQLYVCCDPLAIYILNLDHNNVPIFFYTFKHELFAKCIQPQLQKINDSTVQLFIPCQIAYDSPELSITPVNSSKTPIQKSHFTTTNHYKPSANTGCMKLKNTLSYMKKSLFPTMTPLETFPSDGTSTSPSFSLCLGHLILQIKNATSISYQHLTTRTSSKLLVKFEMTLDGFEAYDISIGQPVLVMSMMLFFLADSPMHAKITNTQIPCASLNPCQIYSLHAPQQIHKNSFILQTWKTTIENTYELYNILINQNITSVKNTRKIFGITHSLNNKVIEGKRKKSPTELKTRILALGEEDITQLFNPFLKLQGFDGCKNTPLDILHVFPLGVVKYLVRDFIKTLKKPKEKKKLAELMAIIFIFFPLMDNEQNTLWHSLAHLSSYVFQTHISYMPTYQSELKQHIQFFMSHIIKFTAQWINKPKFDILLHLPLSILCFGTASLFSSEKFESYNDVLRNSSTHSNKQAPGRDIGLIFKLSILALSIIWRRHMLDFFNKNPTIQKSFGYDPKLSCLVEKYPFEKTLTLKLPELPIPQSLSSQFPTGNIHQISALQLNRHEEVKKNHTLFWGCFFVHVSKMERQPNIDLFYGMRPFIETDETRAVHFQDIKSTLNLQRDCPLHAPEDHRRLADLPANIVCPNEWQEIAHLGLSRWGVIEAPAANTADIVKDSPPETPAETPDRATTPTGGIETSPVGWDAGGKSSSVEGSSNILEPPTPHECPPGCEDVLFPPSVAQTSQLGPIAPLVYARAFWGGPG
ncbi:hypothetical protein VP01_1031g6 [Puccinia sorghi]|uniref:Uncharacterized protein n=1 Tax=Puccinia sorghi TaxID=27349 RepID=A0A0L6VUK1_9BASI|nr:hypothetical protein VP01_1031g6 [Puccinia sorghi]